MEGFPIRGWDLNLSVSGATSTLAGGATLAARWLHEPQPTSNQPVGLGFPRPAGRLRPGDLGFRPRVIEVVHVWKDFRTGDRILSSPDAAGPRRWPEGQL